MARPLRIEFDGALYHITARGNAQQDIYLTDDDREQFLEILQRVNDRHQWQCHAYCLMSNHYHLLIETQTPSLSKGMQMLNGTYTQTFNRTHNRAGHVFQGRFNLETAVGRVGVCGFWGAGQGIMTRNGCSIPRSL